MAQAYQITDNISIINNEDKLILKKDDNTDFIISDTEIIRIDENGETSLRPAEKRTFCHNILRAEFAISENKNITSVKLKQNKKGKFHLSLSADNGDDTLSIDLRYNADTVTIAKEAVTVQKTDHNCNTNKLKINTESTNTDREYTEQKVSACKYPFQTFEDKRSLSLKRVVGDKGRLLTLIREEDKLEEDGFITRHREKSEMTLSASKISKTTQIKDDAYRHKMQIIYDTQTQGFDCVVNNTKFEDITIVEYKDNALTAITGIKTKVTKYIDRDFNARLHLNADDTFTYTQEQTGADGKLIPYTTDSEKNKIAAEILHEIEKMKAVVAKLNILKNNPKTSGRLDFTQNPNLFDEEIGFSEIKNENSARLTETLAHGHAETNRLLLAAVIQNNGGSTLRLALKNGKQNA